MEGDSVPVKNYWLDVILGEIKAYKPFAVLGAQYDGDKWDAFYERVGAENHAERRGSEHHSK